MEQVVPSQLLWCASGWSCLISDASLASPVQRLSVVVDLSSSGSQWLSESFEEQKSCVCVWN